MVELIILVAVMALMMWFMSRSAKKAQKAQMDQREAAVVLGNTVVTSSGFFGKIVDIDGDAVTLESPSGDETVWLKQYIVSQMDLPLAAESYLEEDDDAVAGQISDGTSDRDSDAALDLDSAGTPTESDSDDDDDSNGPEIKNNSPFYDK